MRLFDFFLGDIKPDRFARKVTRLVVRANPSLMPEYQREDFRLKCADDRFINLHNAYRDYLASPRAVRQDMLLRFVQSLVMSPDVPQQFAEVRDYLRPAIRSLALLEYVRLQGMLDKREPINIAHRIVGEDAMMVLAVDSERSMALVTRENLAMWGVSFEAATEIAELNLRACAPDKFARPDPSVAVVVGDWNDGYNSSRILFADLLHRAIGTGSPVAMIPTRETLLVAPRSSPSAQMAMVAMARTAMANSSRKCSAQMFEATPSGLGRFEPDDDAVREALRNLSLQSLQEDYEDQKQLLDRVHEQLNEDTFVASCVLVNKDGKVKSFSTWTEGVTAALLPATEKVALVRPCGDGKPEVVIVEWTQLRERAGHLMNPTGTYPVRYFTSGFPMDLFQEARAAASPGLPSGQDGAN